MASALPSVAQCSPSQPTAFADTTTPTAFTTANNYPILNNSTASILLQNGLSQVHFFLGKVNYNKENDIRKKSSFFNF
jgi:hypothetical protein